MSLAGQTSTAPWQCTQAVNIKRDVADWCVYEQLDLAFTGAGEHVYFFVEKENLNTADVAAMLAKARDLPLHFVGYAGLKDKRGITRQWFSVPQPDDDWPLDQPDIRCLAVERHAKKLRRGQHQANYFEIRLTETPPFDASVVERIGGCYPNFFGPQRTSVNNVQQALTWLAKGQWGAKNRANGRRSKSKGGRGGWHMSVLRSLLFNEVLTKRVELGSYALEMQGDVLLAGLPTGPLWGRGRSATAGAALEIEKLALQAHADTCEALEFTGVDQARRQLAVQPHKLHIESVAENVQLLSFSLPPGAYATALLANTFNVIDHSSLA
jgi:tRNA pseudouridine13 synthase